MAAAKDMLLGTAPFSIPLFFVLRSICGNHLDSAAFALSLFLAALTIYSLTRSVVSFRKLQTIIQLERQLQSDASHEDLPVPTTNLRQ